MQLQVAAQLLVLSLLTLRAQCGHVTYASSYQRSGVEKEQCFNDLSLYDSSEEPNAVYCVDDDLNQCLSKYQSDYASFTLCNPMGVTYTEAQAFCQSKGHRLPSLSEAKNICPGTGCSLNWFNAWTTDTCAAGGQLSTALRGDMAHALNSDSGATPGSFCLAEDAISNPTDGVWTAVRCCDDGNCFSQSDSCFGTAKTHAEADAICVENDLKLCTRFRVENMCPDTDCGYDSFYVRSSTVCFGAESSTPTDTSTALPAEESTTQLMVDSTTPPLMDSTTTARPTTTSKSTTVQSMATTTSADTTPLTTESESKSSSTSASSEQPTDAETTSDPSTGLPTTTLDTSDSGNASQNWALIVFIVGASLSVIAALIGYYLYTVFCDKPEEVGDTKRVELEHMTSLSNAVANDIHSAAHCEEVVDVSQASAGRFEGGEQVTVGRDDSAERREVKDALHKVDKMQRDAKDEGFGQLLASLHLGNALLEEDVVEDMGVVGETSGYQVTGEGDAAEV